MESKKKADSDNQSLSDSEKLAIRDEVERRFGAPPASFTERIETEVEKRLERRVKHYTWALGIISAVIAACLALLYKISLSEIRTTVEKQLSEQEVVKAKDRIMGIKAFAEDVERRLSEISSSSNTNHQIFLERLAQIKKQDNVVLLDDLAKMYVVEQITNITPGQKVVLKYEPMPDTLQIWGDMPQMGGEIPKRRLDHWFSAGGQVILFTNAGWDFDAAVRRMQWEMMTNQLWKGISVGYFRRVTR